MNVIKKRFKINMQKYKNTALTHWVLQKISALLLIPLVGWFLVILKDFLNADFTNKVLWFKNYYNSILLSIFLLVAIFHLRLGLTVVIEDYIHNLSTRKFLLSFLEILCLFLAVFTVIIILILSTGNNV
tara:strand:- start:84 stop:470 length:387 start_codon:yes stop_codon:yes gene_type:complete